MTVVSSADATEVRYVSDTGEPVSTSLAVVDAVRVAGGRPVRRVSNHAGQRHYTGWFWSATNQDHVAYESRLELDRLWLADFDPDVARLATQPLWLSGVDGVTRRRHVPDLLLLRRDGSAVLVDVKPARLLDRPEVADVLAWTGRLCRQRGWTYEVWCGADPVVLANLRWLGQARRPALVTAAEVGQVAVEHCAGMTLGRLTSLLSRVMPGPRARQAVLAALWRGSLVVDLTRPLGEASPLTRPGDRGCG